MNPAALFNEMNFFFSLKSYSVQHPKGCLHYGARPQPSYLSPCLFPVLRIIITTFQRVLCPQISHWPENCQDEDHRIAAVAPGPFPQSLLQVGSFLSLLHRGHIRPHVSYYQQCRISHVEVKLACAENRFQASLFFFARS